MHPARLLLALPLVLLVAACNRSPAPAEPTKAAAATTASPSGLVPIAVTAYLDTLAAVEKSAAPTSLEPLFERAEAAQTALMEVIGEQALLERLDASAFAALQAAVRGLRVHREIDIYAQPEPVFFLTLAKAHGRPEDIAFFERYAQSWGEDLIPVYLKLRPQPTPCVRFGEGRIAPLYAAWQDYRAQYPAAYSRHVQQNLRDLEEAVALGTCACEGLASVQREQADFIQRFPDNPQAAAIKARAAQLASDPDVLPVNCR